MYNSSENTIFVPAVERDKFSVERRIGRIEDMRLIHRIIDVLKRGVSALGQVWQAGRNRLFPAPKVAAETEKEPVQKKIFTRRRVLFLGVFLAVGVALVVGLGQTRPYWGNAVRHETTVLIPTGGSLEGLMDSLSRHDVLRSPNYFRRCARIYGLEAGLQPGRYTFRTGMRYVRVMRMLLLGHQTPVRVTFNNLRTSDRLAGALARKLEPDSLTWLAAFRNDSLLKPYGVNAQTLFTLMIPNTYEFYWTTNPVQFLERMKKESDKFWEARASQLTACGMSREQVCTMASIVYEETKRVEEMPRVAGVYVNRVRIGMPLQADPTVKFALGDFSIRRVLHGHLEVDSPYNTYRYPGLPPGPICMPSIAAIDAVLNYEKHRYLYFCAKDDLSGAHNFAENIDQHGRNAAAYARALNRRGIR